MLEEEESGFKFMDYTSVGLTSTEEEIEKAQERYRKNILENHIFPALEDMYGENDAVLHFQTLADTNPYSEENVYEALKFYEDRPFTDFRLREEQYGWWVFNQ